MLTPDENRTLTAVARGTPMGEVLRRYWQPIAASAELAERGIKPVRVLGEDLVLFRGADGRAGLLDRHCMHRRADLAFGFVDELGLRCSYHGWCYRPDGACVSQPFDDAVGRSTRLRELAHIPAYRVIEHAGLVFAYLGPEPVPQVPNWELFGYENGFAQIVFSDVPCNWLQCQENSMDPVHLEWQHSNWSRVQNAEFGYGATYRQIEFDDFGYGLAYSWLLQGEQPGARSAYSPLALHPNIFVLRNHIEWRVPVDEEHTLGVVWHYTRVPLEAEPYWQQRVPYWTSPNVDGRGRPVKSHVLNQDIIAWAGQGKIADRSQERLGRSDRGVVMIRRALKKAIAAVEAGGDPAGVWRGGGALTDLIHLPGRRGSRRLTRREWLEDVRAVHSNPNVRIVPELFWLAYGQPEEVFNEFAAVAGLDPADIRAAADPSGASDKAAAI